MQAWRHLLGGLLLWAAHFFALYAIASILPGTRAAAVLVLIATALASVMAAVFIYRISRTHRQEHDGLQRWMHSLSASGYALAGAGIVYQGLPAIL